MEKAEYVGPQHYWNQYEIVPREKYIRGYYGMYGPYIDKSLYRPLEDITLDTVKLDACTTGANTVSGLYESFGCGCDTGNVLWYVFVVMVLYFIWTRLR